MSVIGFDNTASWMNPVQNQNPLPNQSLAGRLVGGISDYASGYQPGKQGSGSEGIQFFQPDLFPTSSSRGSNTSSSRTHSGINWQSPFMQALTPQLNTAISAMPGVLDNYARTLQDQQTNLARQALGPQAFQGTLNDLASRGVLNSSVAGNALANTAQPIMQGILNNAYNANLAAQNARLNYPSALAQIANLGQESTGTSRSSGSTSSFSSNPLAPYELAASILKDFN